MLDFECDEARWISQRFREYTDSYQSGSDFRRFRGKNAVITTQVFDNKRGRFIELSKYNIHGRRQSTIVPSGFNLEGWIKITNAMDKLMAGNFYKGNPSFNRVPGAEKLKPKLHQQQMNFQGRNVNLETTRVPEDCDKVRTKKNWNEAIIVTRDRVNSNWELIERVLGKETQRKIELLPFQANKALWWSSNAAEFSYFVNLKRGFFNYGVTLEFEGWSEDVNMQDPMERCCNSWIWISGVPWDLWSPATFQLIGEQCGGLLAISVDTLHLRVLGAAKIKVKGTQGGFIHTKMNIQMEGRNIGISIRVESFDINGYEKYERQTYAQVLVNGKKMMAGWGNNNIYRNLLAQEVLNSKQPKGKAILDAKQGQEKFTEDIKVRDGSAGSGQKLEVTSGFHISKEKTKIPDKAPSTMQHSQGGKVTTILSNIDPKAATKFRAGSIESMNKQQEGGHGSSIDNERFSTKMNRFWKTYCRRGKMGEKEMQESIVSVGKPVMDINIGGDHRPILDDHLEDLQGNDTDVPEDEMKEAEIYYSESESNSSLYYEESVEAEEAEPVDLAGFFSSEEGNNSKPNTPEKSMPNVGQAELKEPAVKGTLNVLKSCSKESSVRRVVLTSSVAAVTFNFRSKGPEVIVDETWFSDPVFCEEIKSWYCLSKTLAEEAAWKFSEENGIDLVVINPGYTIGPLLQPTLNYTSEAFLNLIKGKGGFPSYRFVDVRDVAQAHILGFEKPSASGRYLLVERSLTCSEALEILQKIYPSMDVPKIPAGDPTYKVCNKRAQDLGIIFTPFEVSLKDMIESLKERILLS